MLSLGIIQASLILLSLNRIIQSFLSRHRYCSSITHNLLLFSIKHKIILQMGFDIINGMMSFV